MKFFKQREVASTNKFLGHVDMKHTQVKPKKPTIAFFDSTDAILSEPTKAALEPLPFTKRKIMSSEYGLKALDNKLLILDDVKVITVGILSWMMTREGYHLLKTQQITVQELKTMKSMKSIDALIQRVAAEEVRYPIGRMII